MLGELRLTVVGRLIILQNIKVKHLEENIGHYDHTIEYPPPLPSKTCIHSGRNVPSPSTFLLPPMRRVCQKKYDHSEYRTQSHQSQEDLLVTAAFLN